MTNLIDLPFLRTPHYLREATTPEGAVAEWHADVHTGAFHACLEQPCHAVRAVA